MQIIATLLSKFRKLHPPEAVVKTALIKSVAEHTGVTLEPSVIRFTRGTVFLNLPPTMKAEIVFKKRACIEGANKELETFSRSISDIR